MGNESFRVKVFDIASARASAAIKEGVFNDDFEGIVLYVEKFENAGERMQGIMIYDQREKEGYTIFAGDGSIVSDPEAMTVTMYLKTGRYTRSARGFLTTGLPFQHMTCVSISKALLQEKKGRCPKVTGR